MKSPDEIKKGLECLDKMQFFMGQRAGRELWNEKPHDVQERDLERYNRDVDTVRALIQQLQAENAEQAETIEYLKAEIEEYEESADKCCYESRCNAELNKLEALCNRLMDENEQLEDHFREATKKIEQLEAERDAAVAGLKSNCTCPECKYFSDDIQDPCRGCKPNASKFEWRGVQKEE